MLSVLIIDDESHSRDTIRAIVTDYSNNARVIGEAANIKDGIQAVKDLSPDVILLDIQLGDGSGFELLNKIYPTNAIVIFITAHEEFAIKAFKTTAIDYLLKPVDIKELKQALIKAGEQKDKKSIEAQLNILLANFNNLSNKTPASHKIVIKTTDQIHILTPNEIIHLESDNNYTRFYLVNKTTLLVSKTLKEYEEILDKTSFIRIHQSHIVNMMYASRFDKRNGGFLVLKDNTNLPVSTRKKDELVNYLDSL
ncbi:MAG: LytTR family DNA-binding domain-containing protein [Sediminibacterium sp.]|nr:LytTR family DNA-binding domain-containing protein [Sediminibacterium sp.]